MLVLWFDEMVPALHQSPANCGFRLPSTLPNQEERGARPHFGQCESDTFCQRILIRLAQSATAMARNRDDNSVAGLARFFPEATPVRIPVQLARIQESGEVPNFTESTVIEFGTTREVLFVSKTPLEFADLLRLRNSDGSLDVDASVVAVQYHPGKTVVAARFKGDVPNWIVKS